MARLRWLGWRRRSFLAVAADGECPPPGAVQDARALLPKVKDDSWASHLATAFASRFSEMAHEPVLHSIRIASPESVEVIFSDFDGRMKGLRVDLADVLSAPDRVRASTIEELAFDLVHIGVCEPRALDEFLPPDGNGVRWLPAHRWLK